MDYKNIVICSDGTGNTTVKGRGSNVFKLFEAVDVNGHRRDARLLRQLAFYDDGVGTQDLKWLRAGAGLTGYGLSRNVKQLYRELCRVYEPGDAIYLFGFSRGAFTVRTLTGLIAECGLLNPDDYATEDAFRAQARAAYKAYRRKYRALLAHLSPLSRMGADEFKQRYARRDPDGTPHQPRIRLLGVWDTVDAVGLPFKLADIWNNVIWRFKFKNTSISPIVERACQALALDDERAEFEPVLWNEAGDAADRVEQVWFAGAHSNVGGGYPQHGMSLVALDWMMDRAEQQGLRFAAHVRDEYRTGHSYADKLYDPRAGLGVFYRWKPRNVRALCAKQGIAAPRLHASLVERIVQAPEGYAPGNLPSRCQVVTTERDPAMRLAELASAIASAHGGGGEPSLLDRQRPWLWLGLAAYLTFILGTFGALGRALFVRLDEVGARGVWAQIADSPTMLPFTAAGAVWEDAVARSVLAASLAVGYLLSTISDRRLRGQYSHFWHQHRRSLRTALRRTPEPAAPTAAASADVAQSA